MGHLTSFMVTATIWTLASAKFPFHNIEIFTHTPLTDLGEPFVLTPLIEANLSKEAKDLSRVPSTIFKDVESYSGFFTVDKPNNGNLFFWFFPSAGNYTEDPVVLWLQGGPGESSIISTFIENGPFIVDNGSLSLREYSWHRNHSILYIDQPVGAGFSFTDANHTVTNQTHVGEHLYSALTQFFTVFSELQNNEFFISGESYAGKYVPAIGYTIHQKNPLAKLKINLQGLIIGNGWTDPEHQLKYGDLLYQLGLIDSTTLAEFNDIEDLIVSFIQENRNQEATDYWIELVSSLFPVRTGLSNIYNYIENDINTSIDWAAYLIQDHIREAIHVGNQTYLSISLEAYEDLYADITRSVVPWVAELLAHYRVLIYNGQLDIIVGYVLTENYLKELNFTSAEEYKTAERQVWRYGSDVAGYVKSAGNLTEVMVRNAGHSAPEDQPAWVYDLVTKFTRNLSVA